ncbi:hypothetical protein PVAP13_8KG390230 [Panicum virgatum]|uniref:Uncharacterized protein n=1 Tax=Panicum virgatum TaxID=38727 RepID=A0A8T0PSX2_PANVG|nr:hypothetical protein PVAP13_8KG390230 [Panicum virgatum]
MPPALPSVEFTFSQQRTPANGPSLSLSRREAAAAAPAVAQVFGSPVARSDEAPWRLWLTEATPVPRWRWRGPGRQPISVPLLLRLLQSESGSARSPALLIASYLRPSIPAGVCRGCPVPLHGSACSSQLPVSPLTSTSRDKPHGLINRW